MWMGLKSGLSLAAFAVVAVGLVSFLHAALSVRIASNEHQVTLKRLQRIIPGVEQASLKFDRQNLGEQPLWVCDASGHPLVQIIPLRAQGYAGPIQLLLGIDSTHRVTGLVATRHRETPGIGDVIDYQRSTWIDGFRGLAPADLTTPAGKPAIDTVTGATITTRSVIHAVQSALQNPALSTELECQ